MKRIRDPLYGYITVDDAELPVIQTPEIQRLRRVHQLGLSSAVYPGATHTRFEHSLGVMHLAGEFAASLGLSDNEVRAYRLAGLLHDIGHAPFSHATERLMVEHLDRTHEDRSCRLVDSLEDTLPVDPEFVKNIIRGNSDYDIVAGDIDVDRMDYLRRDATETGLPHGDVDTETIINFATLHDDDVIFDEKAIQALEDLVTSRFHMTCSVYAHHTSKIVECMLERAVEAYLDTTPDTMEDVVAYDDFQLHTALLNSLGEANRLYTRVTNRDLYKRALFYGEDDLGRERLHTLANTLPDPHVAEEQIAAEADVDVEHVIVDTPSPPTGGDLDVRIQSGDNVTTLTDQSPLPQSLSDAEWRTTTLGVYAPENLCDDVATVSQRILLNE